MNRLADEAMYFGAVADGVESQFDTIQMLKEQVAELNRRLAFNAKLLDENDKLRQQLDTAWAQAHRLALELECLIMDTKDNAVVSKWWDSAFEAIEEYNKLKPGAAEDAEAWVKIRKAGI